MISKKHILEWSESIFWQEPKQVEQDLIITKALLNLYSVKQLQESSF